MTRRVCRPRRKKTAGMLHPAEVLQFKRGRSWSDPKLTEPLANPADQP